MERILGKIKVLNCDFLSPEYYLQQAVLSEECMCWLQAVWWENKKITGSETEATVMGTVSWF